MDNVAYMVHPGPGEFEGRVVLVEEGVSGFRPIEDYDSSPEEKRPGIVKRLNERLGVEQPHADKIAASSMQV